MRKADLTVFGFARWFLNSRSARKWSFGKSAMGIIERNFKKVVPFEAVDREWRGIFTPRAGDFKEVVPGLNSIARPKNVERESTQKIKKKKKEKREQFSLAWKKKRDDAGTAGRRIHLAMTRSARARSRARIRARVFARSLAFYLRASIDVALAVGNNAKSPDTSHPQNWSLGGRNFRPASPPPFPRVCVGTCTCTRTRVGGYRYMYVWAMLQGERCELESSTGAASIMRSELGEFFTPRAADKGSADFRPRPFTTHRIFDARLVAILRASVFRRVDFCDRAGFDRSETQEHQFYTGWFHDTGVLRRVVRYISD